MSSLCLEFIWENTGLAEEAPSLASQRPGTQLCLLLLADKVI